MSFGDVLIDHIGKTRDFPTQSALTGLLANALGWRRTDHQLLQELQDRLIFAARIERDSDRMTDTQNAKLEKSDKGWTTWGEPEGRDGASYGAPHRRYRDYLMDARVSVVLTLSSEDQTLNTGALERAFAYPARPLFIGRKPCLPSKPLYRGIVNAENAYQALIKLPGKTKLRAVWPIDNGPGDGTQVYRVIGVADKRRWPQGLHGGRRKLVEGVIIPEKML